MDDLETDANTTVRSSKTGLKNIPSKSLRSLSYSLHRSQNIKSHIVRKISTHISFLSHVRVLNFFNDEEQSIRSKRSFVYVIHNYAFYWGFTTQ